MSLIKYWTPILTILLGAQLIGAPTFYAESPPQKMNFKGGGFLSAQKYRLGSDAQWKQIGYSNPEFESIISDLPQSAKTDYKKFKRLKVLGTIIGGVGGYMLGTNIKNGSGSWGISFDVISLGFWTAVYANKKLKKTVKAYNDQVKESHVQVIH